ncbi:transporter, SSS family [Verrucomicrobiia bacterium DG1235]|nr:transporter, SSS family [Verrucomicrobiae bacterium DG1235]
MLKRPLLALLVLFGASLFTSSSYAKLRQEAQLEELPPTPFSISGTFAGKVGDTLLIAGGETSAVYSYSKNTSTWEQLGDLPEARKNGASVVNGSSLILVGGETEGEASSKVTKLSLSDAGISISELTPLPIALISPAATVNGGTLYVAGGQLNNTGSEASKRFFSLDLSAPNSEWTEKESWPDAPRPGAFLVKSVETLALIGGTDQNGSTTLSYHSRYGWIPGKSAAPAGQITGSTKLGDSHAATSILTPSGTTSIFLYHTIGDTWTPLGGPFENLASDTRIIAAENEFYLLSQEFAGHVLFGEPDTNYGWWDHLSVGLYFLVMLYIGFHFAKQSTDSENYFRGGHKIPWWATGMSLFATGASAMSLMAMPGKAYASNWTFFAISIYSVIALPISMYFFAPLIRKLNFGTAFEYLEERFGLSIRIIGSTIFAVYQILGRMAGVLLLPSFALEAIAGIPMQVSVPIMGLVTIAYTYLGGLSAVIWTDTIQGFVMVAAVAGCLILVFFKIDMPMAEIWTTLNANDKLHIFDWGYSLTDENVFTVFIGIVAVTLLGIGDQNYVQRVQCGPSLKSTKKAIATQMGVAVPINILLFALGTALFLFYKQSPEDLNPVMRNDGIYPFFAAQQLPPGVSGLVIAALLAATMSTVSSSICSVSNLAVDDFYKRFSKNPTEAKSVSVGRIVTLLVGLFGIASAFYLNSFETPSIWDLALRVVSIVTATTVGIYALGLFTSRANEIGTLVGILTGMATTYWLSTDEVIIFWLYPVAGSVITFVVGYAVSLATGGNKKDIDGLTIATIQNRTGGLDD